MLRRADMKTTRSRRCEAALSNDISACQPGHLPVHVAEVAWRYGQLDDVELDPGAKLLGQGATRFTRPDGYPHTKFGPLLLQGERFDANDCWLMPSPRAVVPSVMWGVPALSAADLPRIEVEDSKRARIVSRCLACAVYCL